MSTKVHKINYKSIYGFILTLKFVVFKFKIYVLCVLHLFVRNKAAVEWCWSCFFVTSLSKLKTFVSRKKLIKTRWIMEDEFNVETKPYKVRQQKKIFVFHTAMTEIKKKQWEKQNSMIEMVPSFAVRRLLNSRTRNIVFNNEMSALRGYQLFIITCLYILQF